MFWVLARLEPKARRESEYRPRKQCEGYAGTVRDHDTYGDGSSDIGYPLTAGKRHRCDSASGEAQGQEPESTADRGDTGL